METIKLEVFDEILDVRATFLVTKRQQREYLRIVKTGKPKMVAMGEALTYMPNDEGDNVLLSLRNEELGLHLSFWVSIDQETEINRLMNEGLSLMDAIHKVVPPKNKKRQAE